MSVKSPSQQQFLCSSFLCGGVDAKMLVRVITASTATISSSPEHARGGRRAVPAEFCSQVRSMLLARLPPGDRGACRPRVAPQPPGPFSRPRRRCERARSARGQARRGRATAVHATRGSDFTLCSFPPLGPVFCSGLSFALLSSGGGCGHCLCDRGAALVHTAAAGRRVACFLSRGRRSRRRWCHRHGALTDRAADDPVIFFRRAIAASHAR